MQLFFPPISLTDATLLFGISAIILLITAELPLSLYSPSDFGIDKKRVEYAGIITGIILLILVSFTVIQLIFPK